MKNIAEKLKDKNLKITPQRLAVYNMLYNTAEHPSAEMIYRTLEQDNPSLSLATVYKTLETFKKSRLIQELNVGEGSFRYDVNSSPHPHVICSECREVTDISPIPVIESLKREISNETGFLIESEQIFFFGICKKCRSTG